MSLTDHAREGGGGHVLLLDRLEARRVGVPEDACRTGGRFTTTLCLPYVLGSGHVFYLFGSEQFVFYLSGSDPNRYFFFFFLFTYSDLFLPFRTGFFSFYLFGPGFFFFTFSDQVFFFLPFRIRFFFFFFFLPIWISFLSFYLFGSSERPIKQEYSI